MYFVNNSAIVDNMINGIDNLVRLASVIDYNKVVESIKNDGCDRSIYLNDIIIEQDDKSNVTISCLFKINRDKIDEMSPNEMTKLDSDIRDIVNFKIKNDYHNTSEIYSIKYYYKEYIIDKSELERILDDNENDLEIEINLKLKNN